MNKPRVLSVSVEYSSPVFPTPFLRQRNFFPIDQGTWDFDRLLGGYLWRSEYPKGFAIYSGFKMQRPYDVGLAAHIAVEAPEANLIEYQWAHYVAADFTYIFSGRWQDVLKDTYLEGFSAKFDRRLTPTEERELEAMINETRILGTVVAVSDDRVISFVSPTLVKMMEGVKDINPEVRKDLQMSSGLRPNRILVLDKKKFVY